MDVRLTDKTKKSKMVKRFPGFLDALEEGKLFKYFQLGVVVLITIIILISGIDFSNNNVTTIYSNNENKIYSIKRVSQLPREQEVEQESISVEDEKMTPEELKERYYSYVITKIESNKIYPKSEQKKGHEGTVVVKLFIERGGKLNKVRVVQQARYAKLTKAAIGAIKRSLPFQPYSNHINEDRLILNLEMNYYLH